jgi:hypothetical protein
MQIFAQNNLKKAKKKNPQLKILMINMLSGLAKYVINRIHGLFHIALVISPRLISSVGLKPSGPQLEEMKMRTRQ